jgi:threonine dehydratase
VWVKHENHTAAGAFSASQVRGVIGATATTGSRSASPRACTPGGHHRRAARQLHRDSFRAGRLVEAPVSTLIADGMACRIADQEALEVLRREADEVVAVTDDEVAHAMRVLFHDSHNVAQGAGAAALAAAMRQRERWKGRPVGLALTGGNVDTALFATVLAGRRPCPTAASAQPA